MDEARLASQIIREHARRAAGALALVRATVVAVTNGLVQVKRPEAATADGTAYPRLAGFALEVNDEVLVATLAGEPVVLGRFQRSQPGEQALDVPLRLRAALRTSGSAPSVAPGSAAGTGATASLRSGSNDHSGQVQVVTGSSGTSTGTIVTVTFAQARPSSSYDVWLQPTSAAAQALGVARVTGRSAASFDVAVATAPGTGQTLQWSYLVVET